MDSASKVEYDRLMSEMRAGMAPPQGRPADRLWPSGGRDRIALVVVIAAIIIGIAAIQAGGEHSTFLVSLWHHVQFVAGMGIVAMFGAYNGWRRKAVARNIARQRRAR